jgi:methylglutaconyl-CoA hydratase
MKARTGPGMAESIDLAVDGGVARVALARPEVRNAFNAEVIEQLHDVFARITAADDVRAVVLAGEGPVFCGGADVKWMRASLDLTFEANVAEAERMSDMFRAIDNCPKPVIARIHGAALGGGAGLAAVCDIVIAAEDAIFGFTEVKLGIIPAVISPFVLAKIGASNARALFLTGERFDAARAKSIGLAHEVVPPDQLDAAVERRIAELLTAGPEAVAAAKLLVRRVLDHSYADSRAITTEAIAKQRVAPEGQEGLHAFLERRQAAFAKSPPQ